MKSIAFPYSRSGEQPLVDDLAPPRQPDRIADLLVEDWPAGLLVPEGTEEIEQVAREQGRGIGRERAGHVLGADDLDAVAHHRPAGDAALDIAAALGGE